MLTWAVKSFICSSLTPGDNFEGGVFFTGAALCDAAAGEERVWAGFEMGVRFVPALAAAGRLDATKTK